MYLAFETDGLLGAAKKKTTAKAAPKPTVVPDEIIGGARLQWSVSAGLATSYWSLSLESTEFAKRVGQLRNAMEADPDRFQGVQMAPTKYDNASSLALWKTYPGVIVAEFTSPTNRRSRADVRYDLEQLAQSVGIAVDPSPAHNNLRIISQGRAAQGSTNTGAPAEPGLPTYMPTGNQANNNGGGSSFLTGLGIGTPIVIGGLLLIAVIILKR